MARAHRQRVPRPVFVVVVEDETRDTTTRLETAVVLVAVRARDWLRRHAARVVAGPARDCVRIDCVDGPAIRTCAPVVLRRADGALTEADWHAVAGILRGDGFEDAVRKIERRESREAAA